MSTNIPRLVASSTDNVEIQETSFSIDVLGRFVCNLWEEAVSNPAFDAVVIGAGMYGSYCADKLYRLGASRKMRVLVLEAGGFLLAEHIQDLPNITLFAPPPIDTQTEPGKARNLVWGLPWRSNQPSVGLAYCIGGRSLYWGGWCPRLTDADLTAWPPEVAKYLQANYPLLERQTGVSEPTAFIQGALYDALLSKAASVVGSVPNLTKVEPPPIAVLGSDPASGFFTFNKYSSMPLLIGAIRDAVDEAGGDDHHRRLFLVPRAHVVKLHTHEGAITQIEVVVDGQRRFLSITPNCAVVLAAGAIESTRLALESFPIAAGHGAERMGRNLMAHMRTNFTFRIKRCALQSSQAPLPETLQTAALMVRGETPDGHFHLQVTAAADPNGDSDALLFRMVPDLDQVEALLNTQKADWVSITLRGSAQMSGSVDRPVRDAQGRWIDLSPYERDEFGMRRAYVHLTLSPGEARLWEAMEQAAVAFARKLADDESAIEFIYNGMGHRNAPPPGSGREGLGSTHHESGTLWMGEDPLNSVTDVNGRFHRLTNAYCADQALFPTVGSVNPVLTGLTLARKVAEAIACSDPKLPDRGGR